jgi:hypothetical protein
VNAAALIADTLLRIEDVSADVRKAALLGIARVQTIVTPEQARITLQEGWAASYGLSAKEDPSFEYLTRLAMAAVAPERLPELGASLDHPMLRALSSQFRVMGSAGLAVPDTKSSWTPLANGLPIPFVIPRILGDFASHRSHGDSARDDPEHFGGTG